MKTFTWKSWKSLSQLRIKWNRIVWTLKQKKMGLISIHLIWLVHLLWTTSLQMLWLIRMCLLIFKITKCITRDTQTGFQELPKDNHKPNKQKWISLTLLTLDSIRISFRTSKMISAAISPKENSWKRRKNSQENWTNATCLKRISKAAFRIPLVSW